MANANRYIRKQTGFDNMVTREMNHYRKPQGEEGIETIKIMNVEHQNISEFAFECVDVGVNDKILDIGCGGGVNIEKFHKLTDNNVDGLDYSEVSVRQTIRQNKKFGKAENAMSFKQTLPTCPSKMKNMTL